MFKTDVNKVVVLEPDYFLERIGSEIAVYHPSLTTSLYLNETGALIWELCDGTRTVAEVIAVLSEQYPESRALIHDDVLNLIHRLISNGIAFLREP